jgi:trigger factor
MQVTTEQIDPCKIALTISVEPEKVEAAKEKAFGQFARNLQLPGFRKGKVPPQMARSTSTPGRVQQRAAEMLIQPAYVEALEETRSSPSTSPSWMSMDIRRTARSSSRRSCRCGPVVTLGPTRASRSSARASRSTDADVDRQIEELARARPRSTR